MPARFWILTSWNLLLAIVPVLLALVFARLANRERLSVLRAAGLVIAGLAWLAFLPNTCYLLTEWRHFLETLDATNLYLRARMNSATTLWLMAYTAFYFLYSGFGMLCFALAIRPVAAVLRRIRLNLVIPGVLLFGALAVGVYLGLILRFNSWDLITRPNEVLASVLELGQRPLLSMFLIVFAAFLWLGYVVVDIWVDGLALRLKQWQGLQMTDDR